MAVLKNFGIRCKVPEEIPMEDVAIFILDRLAEAAEGEQADALFPQGLKGLSVSYFENGEKVIIE